MSLPKMNYQMYMQLIMCYNDVFINIADILCPDTINDSDSDVIWKFVKEAGEPGLFHARHSPLEENDILVRSSQLKQNSTGFH